MTKFGSCVMCGQLLHSDEIAEITQKIKSILKQLQNLQTRRLKYKSPYNERTLRNYRWVLTRRKNLEEQLLIQFKKIQLNRIKE